MTIKLPKIKIRLAAALWVIFAVAILIEGAVLARALVFKGATPAVTGSSGSSIEIKINQTAFTAVTSWLTTTGNYRLPEYNFKTSASTGRDNPFLEYR